MITFLKSLGDTLSKGKKDSTSHDRQPNNEKRPQHAPSQTEDAGLRFTDLGLRRELCSVLAKIGYDTPTPIQEKAIPPVINGRDLLGLAQTGTGKTAAFALSILETLLRRESRGGQGIRALVVTPTRELAIQVKDSFVKYGSQTPYRTGVLIGGIKAHSQIQMLDKGVDVLVSTPGRLLDLHSEGHFDLGRLEVLVLDEADRMLDMGFIHDIKRILKIIPAKRQNLFFSATMPDDVATLAHDILHKPVRVEAQKVSSTNENIEQSVYFVETKDKLDALIDIVSASEVERGLVFVKMKWQANRISEKLDKAGVPSAAIHGNKSQNARQKALQDFKTGAIKILVASDLAARGLDVSGISHVFNYDLPDVSETYVHRIGRTGRGGARGVAIAFCSSEDAENLRDIERLIGRQVPKVTDHPRHAQTAETLLAELHARQGTSKRPRESGRNGGRSQQSPRSPRFNARAGRPAQSPRSAGERGLRQDPQRDDRPSGEQRRSRTRSRPR